MEDIHDNPDGMSWKESTRIQMDCHGRNPRESMFLTLFVSI